VTPLRPSAPAEPLARIDAVFKGFREGPVHTRVLTGATLQLRRGETVSLMGVSGSGKSTLLALLGGLLAPDAGCVEFDGRDLAALDDTERARLRARRIGMVLQRDNLIPFLTAAENVALAIELAGGRRPEARARALLCEVGVGARLHHVPRRLSGGEQQRVAVAMALANEPELLLADEVTAQLDSRTAEQVMGVILAVWRARGLTVLYATHSQALGDLAQRRVRLEGGEVRPA